MLQKFGRNTNRPTTNFPTGDEQGRRRFSHVKKTNKKAKHSHGGRYRQWLQ
jgi:hypothetical protein